MHPSRAVDEAKTMIKALQLAAERADGEKRGKERELRAIRALAAKKVATAMAPLPPELLSDELSDAAGRLVC